MDVPALREALRHQPFKPFVMKLVNDRELLVKHPEFVLLTEGNLIHADDEGHITWIEPQLVITLDFLATPTSTSGNGQISS